MKEDVDPKEAVPVFKSWAAWYVLTLALLVIQIIAYHLFTQYFG